MMALDYSMAYSQNITITSSTPIIIISSAAQGADGIGSTAAAATATEDEEVESTTLSISSISSNIEYLSLYSLLLSSSPPSFARRTTSSSSLSPKASYAATPTKMAMNSSALKFMTFIEFNASYHNKLLNETLHYTCPSIQMPVGNLISMILYAIVCIVGLFGNTLVIYVVLRFSKMQTVTNMYILNLAIADECFLIGIPFLITTMYLGEWTFGKAMCKAYMVSTSVTQFTSSIFLFIMSADRYIAVCHPISSPKYRSPFVSRVVTAVAWTTSALIMLPVMLYANTIEKNNKNKMSCIIEWPQEHEAGSGTTFTLYSLLLGFATPLSLILGFYYLVIRKLQTVGPKTKSKEKKRSHRKVTKLVLTVITVYVMCWLPYWISQVALINSPPDICKSRLEITIFVLVGCLGYSNSAMNPILYAFLSDNFKKSFLKACTCAAGKDFNAQLQMENSFFPRFGKRNSEKCCSSTKTGGVGNNTTTNNRATTAIESAVIVDTTSATIAFKSNVSTQKQSHPPALHPPQPAPQTHPTITSGKSIVANNVDHNIHTIERPPVLHTDL